jgi:hypothetical protein
MRRRAAQAHLPDRRHRLRRAGNARQGRHDLCRPAGSLFGVPIVAEKVRMLFGDRGIETQMQRTLTAIDAGGRSPPSPPPTATVEDGLRLSPRHPAAARAGFRRAVGPAWADRWTDQGWVEVDQHTLRHLRYPNIFALGDVAGVPKGKTAASVKWQVPVVEDHLVAAIEGREGTATYNGYTSCPLITRIGRAMLIEFDYNNNLTPSFPGIIAPLEELWISWLMKEVALKATYNAMLRGRPEEEPMKELTFNPDRRLRRDLRPRPVLGDGGRRSRRHAGLSLRAHPRPLGQLAQVPLAQLSMPVGARARKPLIYSRKMARPKGFEPLTPRFVVWCSIQLSYGRALQVSFACEAFS